MLDLQTANLIVPCTERIARVTQVTGGEFLELIKREGRPVFATDIDSTIIDTDVMAFEQLLQFMPNPGGLTARQMWEQYQLPYQVKSWLECPDAKRKLEWYLKMWRINGRLHWHPPPLPGAREMLHRMTTELGIIAGLHVTARSLHWIQLTGRLLLKHNFPARYTIHRVGTAEFESTHRWKAELLMELWPYVFGIVDDHPEVIAALRHIGYPGLIIHYGIHGDTATWAEVYARVADYLRHR